MKSYFNLLIEFRGHNQSLKMLRDYGDSWPRWASAGASPYRVQSSLPARRPRGSCNIPTHPQRVKEGEWGQARFLCMGCVPRGEACRLFSRPPSALGGRNISPGMFPFVPTCPETPGTGRPSPNLLS